MAQGMFGPSAEETRLALSREGQAQDMEWANMEPLQTGVRLAAQAGRQLGGAAASAMGYEDPRMAKAKLLEEAKAEVDSLGVSLLDDPKSYYSKAFESLSKRGLTDEAAGVYNLLIESESTQAETSLKNAQAASEMNKGRYIPLGSGGAYDTATGERIDPAKNSKSQKEIQFLAEALQDPELDEATRAVYEQRLDKLNYIKPEKQSDTALLAGAFSSMADAMRAKEQAETGGKLDAKALDEYAGKATAAVSTIQSLDNIQSALTTGNTTFGSLADTRRNLMSFVTTFLPNSAPAAEKLLKLDVTTFDVMEKEGISIMAEMAKEFGGSRATAQGWQIMQKAGPSVFLTNEGNAIVTTGLRKRAQYNVDRQKFIIDWETQNPGKDIPRRVVSQWELDNIGSTKYTLTPQDFKNIKVMQKKVDRIKRLSKNSKPLPSRDNIKSGNLYYRTSKETGEIEFLTFNAKTGLLEEAE